MVIDAHYHLDERLETVDRLLEQMARHGIDRTALIATMVDPLPEGRLPRALAGVVRVALAGVAGFCAGRGWPLLVSLGPDRDTGDYRWLPEHHPGLTLVYAHAGVVPSRQSPGAPRPARGGIASP